MKLTSLIDSYLRDPAIVFCVCLGRLGERRRAVDPGRAGAKHSFLAMRIISIVYARGIQEFVLPGCLSRVDLATCTCIYIRVCTGMYVLLCDLGHACPRLACLPDFEETRDRGTSPSYTSLTRYLCAQRL